MPVHEVGHLILGKLMGFNLILISFWGISITRNNDWVRIERSHDNQCLMKYNSNPDKLTLSYCIMLSGGFIFNFIFSLISLMLFFAVDNYYLELFLYTAFLVGFINFINNALPVKNNDHMNDGICIWYLCNDPSQSVLLNHQMNIVYSLTQNFTIGRDSLINCVDNCVYENKLTYYCRYINYFIAIKNNDIDLAYDIIKKLLENSNCYGRLEKEQIMIENLLMLSFFRREDEARTLMNTIKKNSINDNTFDYLCSELLYEYNFNVNLNSNELYAKLTSFDYTKADEFVRIKINFIRDITAN